MTYEMYRSIYMICGISFIVMTIVSIFLFIFLKIPAVIGDLTGITARKGIEEIRRGNTKTGNKKYGSSKINQQRGKVTAKISPFGRISEPKETGYGTDTEKLRAQARKEPVSHETTALNQNFQNRTMLLDQVSGSETTVLGQNSEFTVLEDITFLHTEERVSDREIYM